MNKSFIKNLLFLPGLLVVPFIYLAARLLPWQDDVEEGNIPELIGTLDQDLALETTGKELVTQQG